jgi:hypothetical protein
MRKEWVQETKEGNDSHIKMMWELIARGDAKCCLEAVQLYSARTSFAVVFYVIHNHFEISQTDIWWDKRRRRKMFSQRALPAFLHHLEERTN